MAKKGDQKTQQNLPQNPMAGLPPLMFAAKSKTEEARLARLKREKKIRKIGPRLYTSLPKPEVEGYVRAQWAHIVSNLYPNAVLSHRSGLEYAPSPEGRLILTSTTNREVTYPGLTLEFVRGPKAQESDLPFFNFHASSLARAFLENFSASRKSSRRVLTAAETENRLTEILRAKGETELNRIRDHARELAGDFGWQAEFKKMNKIIGALLGTKPESELSSSAGRARARGAAYDASRLPRFDALLNELRATPLKELPRKYTGAEHLKNKAFFEAYFSNYIEGTTFEIEEAEEIVFDKKIPAKRPKDAHDILGTFGIVSDLTEMQKTPRSAAQLSELIVKRHKLLMANRPEAQPGQFKDRPNRAGDSHFVRPDEIEGTLKEGFLRYEQLPKGLARAIYIMFLVAEVHPFADGNGRIARIMMNGELHAAGLSTVIIPNVYRDDYVSALRALTRRNRAQPLIKMLARAHVFSHLEFAPYRKILTELQDRNWFREPDDAKIVE